MIILCSLSAKNFPVSVGADDGQALSCGYQLSGFQLSYNFTLYKVLILLLPAGAIIRKDGKIY